LGEPFTFELELFLGGDLLFVTFDGLLRGLEALRSDLTERAVELFGWEAEVLDLVAGPFLGAFFLSVLELGGSERSGSESTNVTGILGVVLVFDPFLADFFAGADGGAGGGADEGGLDKSDKSGLCNRAAFLVGFFAGGLGAAFFFVIVTRAFLTGGVFSAAFVLVFGFSAVPAASSSLNIRVTL
jgi:hypothetical protein